MANSTTSNTTSLSIESLRRGVLYLAPLLIVAPIFSWTLEAGQLTHSASNPGGNPIEVTRIDDRASAPVNTLVNAQADVQAHALAYYEAHGKFYDDASSAVKPIESASTIQPSNKFSGRHKALWLANYERANEFVSAQIAIANARVHDNMHDHNPKDWQFARNLTFTDLTMLDRIVVDQTIGDQNVITEPFNPLPVSLASINPVAPLALFAPSTDNTHRTIMLDPGHGGSDPGTVGKQGLLEKHLTLDIARRVQLLLAAHPNLNVVLTRQDDKGYSRKVRMERVQMIQPDILISLHLNNLPQKNLTLVESYYASRKNILESELGRNNKPTLVAKRSRAAGYPFVKDSKRLANLLQSHLFNQVSKNDPDAINAGTKEDTLFMLTRSYMPATLIELTCLSNSEEEERLKTTEYRQEIAVALARGILEYFTTEHHGVKS